MTTIVLDLHGVLVNTTKMQENYELLLIQLYGKYGIDEKTARQYHKKGLAQFLQSIQEISAKNFIGEQFLKAMKKSDHEWDKLMNEPFMENKNKQRVNPVIIHSREVERLAGSIRDVFYEDGKQFLSEWKNEHKNKYDIVIASNSHSVHIKSIVVNYDPSLNIPIIGWDDIQCLKSHPEYYSRLKTILNQKGLNTPFIMIGNSSDEMIGAHKHGFIPILIKRDRKVNHKAITIAKKVFPNLNNVWPFILSLEE